MVNVVRCLSREGTNWFGDGTVRMDGFYIGPLVCQKCDQQVET